MDGNSRIPILVSLEIANLFAGTNVIQVILPIRVITLVLKYSDRNPLFFLLLFIQQTWCVISHLKPHIISIALNVSQSLNTGDLSCISLKDWLKLVFWESGGGIATWGEFYKIFRIPYKRFMENHSGQYR